MNRLSWRSLSDVSMRAVAGSRKGERGGRPATNGQFHAPRLVSLSRRSPDTALTAVAPREEARTLASRGAIARFAPGRLSGRWAGFVAPNAEGVDSLPSLSCSCPAHLRTDCRGYFSGISSFAAEHVPLAVPPTLTSRRRTQDWQRLREAHEHIVDGRRLQVNPISRSPTKMPKPATLGPEGLLGYGLRLGDLLTRAGGLSRELEA
jgi:hypothetical protein